jgi:hypothetical protein
LAENLKISRLLGGDGKAFLGTYDTLGKFGKLGNVYAAGGGYKDSPLAGGMIEVETTAEFFVVKNPITAPAPEAPPAFVEPSGGDGGRPGGAAGGPGSGESSDAGADGGGDGGSGGGDGGSSE